VGGEAQTVDVGIEDPDTERTYTFRIDEEPVSGDAVIDESTGLLTFTPLTPMETDSLTVEATDDGQPPRSGTLTITVTVEEAG
jgi:hypothetical protein